MGRSVDTTLRFPDTLPGMEPTRPEQQAMVLARLFGLGDTVPLYLSPHHLWELEPAPIYHLRYPTGRIRTLCTRAADDLIELPIRLLHTHRFHGRLCTYCALAAYRGESFRGVR